MCPTTGGPSSPRTGLRPLPAGGVASSLTGQRECSQRSSTRWGRGSEVSGGTRSRSASVARLTVPGKVTISPLRSATPSRCTLVDDVTTGWGVLFSGGFSARRRAAELARVRAPDPLERGAEREGVGVPDGAGDLRDGPVFPLGQQVG